MENVTTIISFFEQSPWLLFVGALALLIITAFVLTPIVFSLLEAATRKTKTDLDDKLFAIVKPPVFWSIVFGGAALLVAHEAFALPFVELLQRLFLSALIVVWIRPLSKASQVLLGFAAERGVGMVQSQTLPLFRNTALVIIWSLAVYFLFAVWGISLTAWLASAGIVGIAVGFAAKDTLANLISGIFILADAPYKVGDVIVLDSGERGEVIAVGLRSTRIRTYDGVEITVPNALMGNSRIINETGTHVDKKLRVHVPIGVGYDTDIAEAERILLAIAGEFEEICKDPEPQVKFIAFGASSLDLELRFWVPEPSKRGVKDKVHRRILEEFRKAGIEIPYQKIDVHLIK